MKLKIKVQMYRVGFGDCFLVTFTSAEREHRILFDCGRHAGSTPVEEEELAFEKVIAKLIDDIPETKKDGRNVRCIDIIVATHRHRDHVHGFSKTHLWKDVVVGEVWMPWVEDREDQHARRLALSQEQSARRALSALKALKAASDQPTETFDSAIEIVYNSTTNKKAMDFLHDGLQKDRKRFLPRLGYFPDSFTTDQLGDRIPYGVTLHVLGPSRDPEVITSLQPPPGVAYEPLLHTNGLNVDEADEMGAGTAPEPFGLNWVVKAGEYELTKKERHRIETAAINGAVSPLELAYRLDQSLNGTSLVIVIEAGDVKLLFSGDAQWGTWNTILRDSRAAALIAIVQQQNRARQLKGQPRAPCAITKFTRNPRPSECGCGHSHVAHRVHRWRHEPLRFIVSAAHCAGRGRTASTLGGADCDLVRSWVWHLDLAREATATHSRCVWRSV